MRTAEKSRRAWAAVALMAAVGLVGGCGKGKEDASGGGGYEMPGANEFGKNEGSPGESPEVSLKDLKFNPNPNTVVRGTEVTWTSLEPTAHTVTSGARGSPDGKFDKSFDAMGTSLSFLFDAPGTFYYFCKIHASMNGQIIVK